MSILRPETSTDHDGIRHVNRLAFGQDAEARLVDALRNGGYVRASLVAVKVAQVVGHLLFSHLPIVTKDGPVPALALAPMAVLPEFQMRWTPFSGPRMRHFKVEVKPLFPSASRARPLSFFVSVIPSPREAGWAERSDPERSDGSRSGAQPASRVPALIPA